MSLSLTPVHDHDAADAAWWRHAVIYQIYPRSFADADGNGIGDLPGARAKLGYLKDLGVDAVWFSPFFVSPQADAGYDVADYRDIDPLFGTLADFEGLLQDAERLGLKIIVDLVPNHSSDEHPWFQAALASPPGSPERERYMFRDGLGDGGWEPPNNWESVFGGPAWTRVTEADGTPGQWYLHLFDTKQPDFNWDNAEVHQEFLDILSFWVERGVAGFRVDVAAGLVKKPGLPDYDGTHDQMNADADVQPTANAPMWDQDGVHAIFASWRALLDTYGEPDRILCAEAWVHPPERAALYVRPTEFHQAFNFDFLECPWRAADYRRVITHSLRVCDTVGAPATWVLSNHDVVRHATRLALPVGERRPNGIFATDPQPDLDLGLRRARAGTAMMLGLTGSAYVYQGEELGLPEATDLPDELREDPVYLRTGKEQAGRDGCRVPLPWAAGEPGLGFGPTGKTWLPQPDSFAPLAADAQDGVEGSTLELYRSLLRLRHERELGLGSLSFVEDYADPDVLAFVNTGRNDAYPTLVVVNFGAEPVALPAGVEVLVASGPLVDEGVPTDTTVWAALSE